VAYHEDSITGQERYKHSSRGCNLPRNKKPTQCGGKILPSWNRQITRSKHRAVRSERKAVGRNVDAEEVERPRESTKSSRESRTRRPIPVQDCVEEIPLIPDRSAGESNRGREAYQSSRPQALLMVAVARIPNEAEMVTVIGFTICQVSNFSIEEGSP
jgi:hypothetical protein